jgi:hypothetical protein
MSNRRKCKAHQGRPIACSSAFRSNLDCICGNLGLAIILDGQKSHLMNVAIDAGRKVILL